MVLCYPFVPMIAFVVSIIVFVVCSSIFIIGLMINNMFITKQRDLYINITIMRILVSPFIHIISFLAPLVIILANIPFLIFCFIYYPFSTYIIYKWLIKSKILSGMKKEETKNRKVIKTRRRVAA